MRYTTYGSVRGQGPVRDTEDAAERDLLRDRKGCRAQGGYSDRELAYIGEDGYLYLDEACENWIAGDGGATCGAARAIGI